MATLLVSVCTDGAQHRDHRRHRVARGGAGIDFHRPLRSSACLEQAHALLRTQVTRYGDNRLFAPDIGAAKVWAAGRLGGALCGIICGRGVGVIERRRINGSVNDKEQA